DTGTAPPASRIPPVHETMCFTQGAWSHCGSIRGTNTATVFNCDGPGVIDTADGVGVWAKTSFSLKNYVGQRVRVRWIGASWVFDDASSSYFEVGPGWNTTLQDDGWWIDDIVVSGTIQTPTPPPIDNLPASSRTPPSVCPTNACNPALGDHGTNVVLKVIDLDGNVLDGTTKVAVAGRSIRVSAVDSTLPGGCVGGALQFQFFKNGALVQDWTSKSFYEDAPEISASYSTQARCSSFFTSAAQPNRCTSTVGASIDVPVYSGDGGEALWGQKTAVG